MQEYLMRTNSTAETLPLWSIDSSDICAQIETSIAPLKLCVKVKNESLLLEQWIEHHANIVGYQNLIVADNDSTDQNTLAIYKKYEHLLTVFRFKGPHNHVHWHPRFGDFFSSIKNTSTHFSFIDCDERLIWIEDHRWSADNTIVARLSSHRDGKIIPATWLINTFQSFENFSLLDTEGRPFLTNNLKWGKPIMSSDIVGLNEGIHTAQLADFGVSCDFGTHLFLLHLTQFPEQRVRVNRNKLLSRGVIDESVLAEEIPNIALQNIQDNTVERFAKETAKMLEILSSGDSRTQKYEEKNFLSLLPSNAMHFSNEHTRDILSDYMANGPAIIRAVFKADTHGAPNSAHVSSSLAVTSRAEIAEATNNDSEACSGFSSLMEEKLDLRGKAILPSSESRQLLQAGLSAASAGDIDRAERLFAKGMSNFPDLMDEHGDPVFHKELIRVLVNNNKWEKAKALVADDSSPGMRGWHHIIFARALDASGQSQAARIHWQEFIQSRPNHPEAKAALAAKPSNARNPCHAELGKQADQLSDAADCIAGDYIVAPPSNSLALNNVSTSVQDFPQSPHLDAEGLKLFGEACEQCSCYLEYGVGGSTRFVAINKPSAVIIGVDTDKDRIAKTKLAVQPANAHLEWCNVGIVGEWGFPINKNAADKYWTYIVGPWEIAHRLQMSPDTVLVDGRFRVAAFLYSFLNAKVGARLLFDDYAHRDHYHIVESVARPIEQQGRMAIFKKTQAASIYEVSKLLVQHVVDPR